MKNQKTYYLRRVVEYRDFFAGEQSIDIYATLKLFSRDSLIRAAAVFSHHYGNMSIPNNELVLFSESSKKYIPYLNRLFKDYYVNMGIDYGEKVEILTYRTSLELWRYIFAIRVEDYTNIVNVEDFEFLLFKVILTINERIVHFNDKQEQYKLDELIFLNGFLTNDSNQYDFKAIMQPQMYYFRQLVEYIQSNDILTKATNRLFHEWGIQSWREYFTSILCIATAADKFITNNAKGVPIATENWIDNNKRFISYSLIESLCIEEDKYIPYNDEIVSSKELNIDYRRFRSQPFVKLKDGTGYIVINNQLLCERLFNSLYFDFSPLINGGKNSVGTFDYNKGFIEKILFRNTFFNCIRPDYYTFPNRNDNNSQEKPHEPDFYARNNRGELIIIECKAIKMNGECRDDGDYARLLNELHEKLVLKTKNLDKTRKEFKGSPEPIGVGQLVHHIDSIDADSFEWDTNIPDDVCYYPLLVFEDVKLLQTGILSIVNRWFYEELAKEEKLELSEALMPIMVVSINTLYLYDNLLCRRGLTNVIKEFVRENARYDSSTRQYHISPTADFDYYLRKNPFEKSEDAILWMRKMMNKNELV